MDGNMTIKPEVHEVVKVIDDKTELLIDSHKEPFNALMSQIGHSLLSRDNSKFIIKKRTCIVDSTNGEVSTCDGGL